MTNHGKEIIHMKISEHFDDSEFKCKCGCGKIVYKQSLIDRLEKLYSVLNAKSIVITSGYRCPKHSVAVGGYSNDAHTLGFASDVIVYKQDGTPYTVETVAYYADKLGFGGIGMMSGNAIHLDTRDCESYVNNYWHGDERNGTNFIASTLSPETVQAKTETDPTCYIKVDGKKVWSGKKLSFRLVELGEE